MIKFTTMPLYEYECQSCKKVHEVMQKFSDAPLKTCPECGKPVTKLMSLSSFALKGTGWYTTDYKRSQSSQSSSSSGTKSASAGSQGSSPSPADTATSTPKETKSDSGSSNSNKSE